MKLLNNTCGLKTIEDKIKSAFKTIIKKESNITELVNDFYSEEQVNEKTDYVKQHLKELLFTDDDVMELCSIGRNKTLEFIKKLKDKMKAKGLISFSNSVPMRMLISKLNMDIDFMLSLYKTKKYVMKEEKA